MSNWPLSRDDIRRPAYRSLAHGIAAAIGSGELRAGERLPTHRDLAWQLDVSVQTVSRAYEELIRADLVSGEVGRGTFVLPQTQSFDDMPWSEGEDPRQRTDLSLMTPVHLDEMRGAWQRSLARIAAEMPDILVSALRPEEIRHRYRVLATEWLARCGLVVGDRRVTITNGGTPAMYSALSVVAKPGEIIATDPFTSHTLAPAAHQLHIGLRAVSGDERGMSPDALIDAARESQGQIKAVFLLPGGAGPTARVMDRERRMALAEAAAQAGITILESDPLGPLHPRRPPPIASFAPDRTFYVTSMSKVLSPGLRIGFLVAPETHFEASVNRHTSIAWMATPMIAEIAHDWVRSGTADSLLSAHRVELAARNRLARKSLPDTSTGERHGLHRWVPLPERLDESSVVARLHERGIAVTPGARFAVGNGPAAIRVCLGGASRGALERACAEITALLS